MPASDWHLSNQALLCLVVGLHRLIFGTLYPAYSSYKAVKTKNVKEYVKWMMYWIVFAFFTTAETLTDIILSWFPFYFELKIAFVIWLLSPYTKGSSVLYRKFVHPTLSNKEKEIDEYISQARDRSYETMMRFGKRGLNLAANAAVTAAAKGPSRWHQKVRQCLEVNDGGGHLGQGVLSEKLRSFSMQDLTLIRDEETLHLHAADPRLRTSTSSLLDSLEDASVASAVPRGKARPVASPGEDVHSKSDGEQTETRTEQSDEDTGDKAPKRTQSVKTVKKPAAKAEPQTKTLKRQPKKKTTAPSETA
ncbi:REEP2 protein, partial [Polypterus senegalus]|nr:REEP2 protein [Polypterus senegalus]